MSVVPEDRDDLLDTDQVAAPAVDQQNEGDEETEARARRAGWTPEDEWDDERAEREGRRKPKQFVTASEFLKRVDEEGPILRQTVRRLDKEVAEGRKRLSEMEQIFEDQRRMNREAIERARRDEREKIEKRMDEAAANGDVDGVKAARADLAKVDAQPSDGGGEPTAPVNEAPEKPQQPARDPVVARWIEQNPWFNDDELQGYTVAMFGKKKAEMAADGSSTEDILAATKRVVMERFPEKFGSNPRRQGAPAVGGPTGQRSQQGGVESRFASIPAADQQAYERTRKMIEARGGKFTKAQFLEDYGM